jgi:hypothetical protein
MALQKVTLGLAERRIISGVLNRQEEVDVRTARDMREIRNRLEIRKTDKLIDRMTEEAAEARVRIPDWDDLFDLAAWLAEVNEELAKDEEERTSIELKKHEKELAGAVERTIDENYIQWLKKALEEVKWNRLRIQRGQGQFEDVTVTLPLGQVEAIASTADALDAVQEVKGG